MFFIALFMKKCPMNVITLIKLILDARENTEVVVYGGSGPI